MQLFYATGCTSACPGLLEVEDRLVRAGMPPSIYMPTGGLLGPLEEHCIPIIHDFMVHYSCDQ